MAELLGDAILEVSVDFDALLRDLAAAKAKVAAAAAEMERMLHLHAKLDLSGLYDRAALAALARDLGAVRKEAEQAVTALRRLRAEGAPIAFSAAPAGPSEGTRGETPRGVLASLKGLVWGVRGPDKPGSPMNPITVVIEAGSRTPLGPLAAAIGEEGPQDRSSPVAASSAEGERPLAPSTILLSDAERARLVRDAAESLRMAHAALAPPPERLALPEPGRTVGGTIYERTLGAELAQLREEALRAQMLEAERAALAAAFVRGSRVQQAAILRRLAREGRAEEVPTLLASAREGEGRKLAEDLEAVRALSGGEGGGGINWRRMLMGAGGLWGLAQWGSLGSFAGLGPEHVAMTVLGVLGSAAEAAFGAGLKLLGAGAATVVGGGSTAGTLRSTISDTQTLYKAYEHLERAIAVYGRNSRQAAEAQRELNATMAELGNTAGVKAEAGLARATAALNSYYDQASSTARVRAVELLQEGVKLAYAFVPRVLSAAEENLVILKRGLRPLFHWLEGPEGENLWNRLETVYAGHLPKVLEAFAQGFELISRVATIAAEHTGGLVTALDNVLRRWNALSDPALLSFMDRVWQDTAAWANLLKLTFADLVDFFRLDAHTGRSLVELLDSMLARLHAWLQLASSKGQIRSIFFYHREEVLLLIQAIVDVGKAFTSIYLSAAPLFTRLFDDLLKLLIPFLNVLSDIISRSRILSLIFATLLIAWRMERLKQLVSIFSTLAGWMGRLAGVTGLFGKASADAAKSTEALASAQTKAATAAQADAEANANLATAEEAATGAATEEATTVSSSRLATLAGGLKSRIAGIPVIGSIGSKAGSIAGKLGQLATRGLVGYVGGQIVGEMTGNATATTFLSDIGAGASAGSTFGGFGAIAGAALGAIAAGVQAIFGGEHVVKIRSLTQAVNGSAAAFHHLMAEVHGANKVFLEGQELPRKMAGELLAAARRAAEGWKAAFNTTWTLIHNWASSTTDVARHLNEELERSFRAIASHIGLASQAGEHLASEAMHKMVVEVARAMHEGRITTHEGMAAIEAAMVEYSKATGQAVSHEWRSMFEEIQVLQREHLVNTEQAAAMESAVLQKYAQSLRQTMSEEEHRRIAEEKERFEQGVLNAEQFNQRRQAIEREYAGTTSVLESRVLSDLIGALTASGQNWASSLQTIVNNTNAVLKSLGAAEVPRPQLEVAAAVVGFGQALERGASSILQGLGQGLFGHSGHAQGGLIQVGHPGEAGYDSVPLMVGAEPIVVAPGETVAVFNRHQLPIVEAALAPIGGLEGLFATVNRPHYMATGGVVGMPSVPSVKVSGFGVIAKILSAAGRHVNEAVQAAVARAMAAFGIPGPWHHQAMPALERLWVAAGGPPVLAHLMAAIAMAESSGNPNAIGPPTESGRAMGLWQIMMPVNAGYVHGNVFDPLVNARAAVAIYRAQGLRAWETYDTGAYRAFYARGGIHHHGDSHHPSHPHHPAPGAHLHHLRHPHRHGPAFRHPSRAVALLANIGPLFAPLESILGGEERVGRVQLLAEEYSYLQRHFEEQMQEAPFHGEPIATVEGRPRIEWENVERRVAQLQRLRAIAEEELALLAGVPTAEGHVPPRNAYGIAKTIRHVLKHEIPLWKKRREKMHEAERKTHHAVVKLEREIQKEARRLEQMRYRLRSLHDELRYRPKNKGTLTARAKHLEGEIGKSQAQLNAWREQLKVEKASEAWQHKQYEEAVAEVGQKGEALGGRLGEAWRRDREALISIGGLRALQQAPVASLEGGQVAELTSTIAELNRQLRELGQPVLEKQLREQAAGGEASNIAESLNQVLLEQLQAKEREDEVLRRQYQVLINFPPYAGAYATGGVVPGPPGAPRTIIAHGGETVLPQGAAPEVHIHFAPGTEWLRDFLRTEVRQQTRKIAMGASNPVPSLGGGLIGA
jgi:hypothetical protein